MHAHVVVQEMQFASRQHKSQSADFASQIDLLKQQKVTLQDHHTTLQQQHSNLQSKHAGLRQEHARLQTKHTGLQQQHQNLQDQQVSSQLQHGSLQQQHAQLQQQQQRLQQQHDDAQQHLQAASQELAASRAQAQELQKALNSKGQKLLSLQADSCLPATEPAFPMQHSQIDGWHQHQQSDPAPLIANQPAWDNENMCFSSLQSCPSSSDSPDNAVPINTGASRGSHGGSNCETGQILATVKAVQQAAEQLVSRTQDTDKLALLSVAELQRLETTCQAVLSNMQAVSQQRAQAEVLQLSRVVKQLETAAEDRRLCSLCMEADKDVVLNCGHQSCQKCCDMLTHCPFCSAAITLRIRVF